MVTMVCAVHNEPACCTRGPFHCGDFCFGDDKPECSTSGDKPAQDDISRTADRGV